MDIPRSTDVPTKGFAPPIACAPHFTRAPTAEEARMMNAIKAQTEVVREALRKDSYWGASELVPPRGFPTSSERAQRPAPAPANFIPWPALLTVDDCVEAAAAASHTTAEALLTFAIHICPFEYQLQLLQFAAHRALPRRLAKVLSPVILGFKGTVDRIKAGARTGAAKSATTRSKTAKTPSATVLLVEFNKLVKAGRAKTEVASVLARRYGVTATTIRRKLKSIELARSSQRASE